MPRNIQTREWLAARKKPELPQDAGRTQESLDAETRVRAGSTTGLPFTEDGGGLTNQDWINIDRGLTFVSPRLGQLADIEENRLAAKAHDEMGWPMGIMTGCTKDFATSNSCGLNIRQMAYTRYDPAVHKQQTEEEWECLDIRQRDRVRIERNLRALKAESESVLPRK